MVELRILPFYMCTACTDEVFDYFSWFRGGDATELGFVSGKKWVPCSEDLRKLHVNANTQKSSLFRESLQSKFLAGEHKCETLQFIENCLVLSAIWAIWINSPDRNGWNITYQFRTVFGMEKNVPRWSSRYHITISHSFMSPAVRLKVVSTCIVRALWMRVRRRDRNVNMRMPPCWVDMMEWMYRSSMGFNKSFAIRSATPVVCNVTFKRNLYRRFKVEK